MTSSPTDLTGLRVVVTGGSGFIGSHVVQALLKADADVTVVAPDPGRRPLPPRESDAPGLVRTHALDVLAPSTTAPELDEVLSSAQALIHLEYRPAPPSCTDVDDYESTHNQGGLRRLLGRVPASVRHILFASSVLVYGPGPSDPISEDVDLRPATPYGRVKQRSEELLIDWAHQTGHRATVLRLGTVFGPGETVPRAIPNFIRAALAGRAPTIHGSGDDVRDYVHVRDVSRGILHAVTRTDGAPDTFNLASGVGRTTRDIADLVNRLTGSPHAPVHLPREAAATRIVCDVERAWAALGFRAETDFVAGLQEEVAWFTRHPGLWDTQGPGPRSSLPTDDTLAGMRPPTRWRASPTDHDAHNRAKV